MKRRRAWFWQIEEMRQGPDSYLVAKVKPAQAPLLADVVQHHLPEGFVWSTPFYVAHKPTTCSLYEVYMDGHTAEQMIENRKHNRLDDFWYYGCIEVIDNALCIEHILAPFTYDNTDVVVAIANAPALTLQTWSLGYKGYAVGEVASGTDATSLLRYLRAQE